MSERAREGGRVRKLFSFKEREEACAGVPTMQEEAGETLGGGNNRGSMWLCPLCQDCQPDRQNLSFHLTDKHSVLPACLEKLLDIAAPKHAEDKEPKAQNDANDTTQQKHLENTKSSPMAVENESESTDAGDKDDSAQDKEMNEEIEGGNHMESEAVGLESDQDNVDQSAKTPEVSVSSGTSVNTNSVASEVHNRPFKCNACLESFPTKTALSVHYNSTTHIQRMRTGTVNESDSAPFLARPYLSNKPYQCAVCRVSYSHAITLESHLKSVLHQSRSRSAGNATASSTASTGNGTVVTNLAATTVGSPTQLVNASTSNCVTQANLTTSAGTTKDGEQVQPQSVLSSPVASAQAMSAILTLLTSSPNSLPHSILPSLFTTTASSTPGAASPQLIPQTQMIMPLVLNGMQTQIHGQNPDSPNQLLQQAVPVLGLSAAQQALLAQRLSGLQSQWAAFGVPTTTTTPLNLEETNKGADMKVKSEIKVEPSDQQRSLKTEEDWEINDVKKEFCNNNVLKQELRQLKSDKMVDDGTMCDDKEQEESDMKVKTGEKGGEKECLSPKGSEASASSVSQLSGVSDANHDISHKHNVNSSGLVNCTFRNTNLALRSGHRSAKAHPILASGRPLLTEFQSQVLWAFLESRDDAATSSPQREDCEALGREVGLTGEEVRRWFLDAWHAKDRERLDDFHDEGDRSLDDEEGNLMIDESEDGESLSATGQAIDLSSSAERHREITGKGSPRELLLTSDSENEEFYTSFIVTDEESQNSSLREESGSPVKQSSQVETTVEKASCGGKVLRSTTVFLSDAEDEDDDESSAKRRKRKSEIDKEEVDIKREKQDIDLDLQLEEQADPPTPLTIAVDHQGVPTGILQSLPLSLSLAPLSTQLYNPYVLSLPSSLIGVGVSEGDRGKVAAFSNTQAVTRSPAALSDPLNASATSSLTHSFLSNGNDGESALDLSIGKNHSSTVSSSLSTANKVSVQKSNLLDGLGLRPATVGVPADGGLFVVQVKPESAIAIPCSNNSTISNRNNLAKTSTVYMRAAEKVSTSLMEREKDKEQEKDQDQKRPKVRRFRDMRRSRTIIHADQLDILYGCYFKDPNPGKHEFEQISEWVNLPKKVVQIWFQNMRARERKGEVRFISDGTLAAVGKPLIKFTWPLSKPIFSSPPKPNTNPSTILVSAKPQTGNIPTKTDKVKEIKESTKTSSQGPSRSNETPSFTVVSTSPSAHKTKAEATPITMVKIAPKAVATPVAVPLLVSGTSRSAQKRKVESDHTDDDDPDYQVGSKSGTTRTVPKLSTTPINKSSALASQKHNGVKYWSQKGPFKINTLTREQLGLSSQRPTPTPAPTPTLTPSPVTVTPVSGQSQKEMSYMQNFTPRRPRTHLNGLQLSILQSCYETCAHPNAMECEAVGTELGLPLKVVQIWFQNTRAKEKRWRLQQEKMSPNPSDPSKKIDISSGSYLQYNALRANRPILPKPVQLTVVESSSFNVNQSVGRETLRGKCDACKVEFESRAAARDHVFSPRHLATLKTTNFGQLASLVSNGSGTGSTGFASQSSSPSPASNSS